MAFPQRVATPPQAPAPTMPQSPSSSRFALMAQKVAKKKKNPTPPPAPLTGIPASIPQGRGGGF